MGTASNPFYSSDPTLATLYGSAGYQGGYNLADSQSLAALLSPNAYLNATGGPQPSGPPSQPGTSWGQMSPNGEWEWAISPQATGGWTIPQPGMNVQQDGAWQWYESPQAQGFADAQAAVLSSDPATYINNGQFANLPQYNGPPGSYQGAGQMVPPTQTTPYPVTGPGSPTYASVNNTPAGYSGFGDAASPTSGYTPYPGLTNSVNQAAGTNVPSYTPNNQPWMGGYNNPAPQNLVQAYQQATGGGNITGLSPTVNLNNFSGGSGQYGYNPSSFNPQSSYSPAAYGTTGGAGGPDQFLSSLAQTGMNPMTQLAQGNYGANPGAGMLSGLNFNPLTSYGTTSGNMAGLNQIIAGQGNPVDQTGAWNAMVQAQQQNINTGMANLAEQFNVGDNRFSSAFGTAAQQYMNQATLNQNMQLTQAQNQALQAAQNNYLSAATAAGGLGLQGLQSGLGYGVQAGQALMNPQLQAAMALGGYGYGGGSQLSSQGAQSQMQQYGLAGNLSGLLSQQSSAAANQLAQLGYGGSQALYGGSLAGAQGMFGAENQSALSMAGYENAAANALYQGQNSMLPSFMQNSLAEQQLGLQGAQAIDQLWNQNLQTGAGLGQQQYQTMQAPLTAAMQNWQYTQPQNNPFLAQMFSAATSYPAPVYPSYQQGALGSLFGMLGSTAIGAGTAVSDIRLKENIQPIGVVGELPLYLYNFKGLPGKQIGFIAQEVFEHYPEAVVPGDDSTPWMIRPAELMSMLTSSVN